VSFHNKRIIKKPRKQYNCELCGSKIVGEHYYIACVQDGSFFADRYHSKCYDAIESHCIERGCGSGECEGSLNNCFDEYLRKCEMCGDVKYTNIFLSLTQDGIYDYRKLEYRCNLCLDKNKISKFSSDKWEEWSY
jgi:hypothetical protein